MFAKTKHEPAKQSRGSSPFSHSAKTAHCPSLAQASLEYLLTYGWALILIATIVGVLVLIVSTPSGYACSRGLGRLICKAFGAQGEDLIITLQNATGQDISINPFSGIAFDGRAGYAIITYRGQQYRFQPTTISKGDTFQITGIGLGNAGTASITYTETQTGMTRTETINLDTPQQETCNNGIDDDVDGKIDCLDTDECEACKYNDGGLDAANSSIPATISPGSPATIQLNPITNLTEAWEMTEAKVYFKATNVSTSPQPTATASYRGKSASQIVTEGWNEIIIDTAEGEYPGFFDNFTLSTTQGSFTLSEPKAMVTLKKFT